MDAPDSFPDPAELETLGATLPPQVLFGTTSWTYPGWQGLIYHRPYPKTGAAGRMLEEYARFPLFRTVGIDSSFYRPLTPKTYADYGAHLPVGFPCVSKVWNQITVHTFTREQGPARAGQPNPDFLNAELFVCDVLEPTLEHFHSHAGPFVLEFQTIARKAGMTALEFADRLDAFLSRLPRDATYAVEVRNAEFLTPAHFAVLREHGVAHVFNSWTRMPSIGEQLDLPGSIPATFLVARVLLRPGRVYQEAVDAFAPYDRVQDPNPELRADVTRLIERAVALRIPAYVLVGNRAEGNSPRTIAAIARMLADRQRRAGGRNKLR